ncbi:MAG: DNA repair protein RadA [Coprothermobacterota bacterium]|nr:DNA repair protein RadA [Coprothermobacterota bacterium]
MGNKKTAAACSANEKEGARQTANKSTTTFICGNCGYHSVKALGRCPVCNQWNTFTSATAESLRSSAPLQLPLSILEVPSASATRLPCGIGELDRVLGGGLVQGSCVLLAGEPGIGKSTLLLQMAQSIAARNHRVLYVSGEESPGQIKIRAERLEALSPHLLVSFQAEVGAIEGLLREANPSLLIVDSIQTMASAEVQAAPGSVLQVRECAARLFTLVKEANIPLVLAGHVTKDGNIAGPKLLEHLVDVVIYFEGDRSLGVRVLRAHKNRFGDTSEIGLFQMTGAGLREMSGVEHLDLSEGGERCGGVLTATLDGARVLLVEVQALVSQSFLPVPRRVVNGFDFNRLLMVLAILDKHGVHLGAQDVYVNVLGGVSLADPGADLAVAVALVASHRELTLPPLLAVGELGLGGEVRSVPNLEKRLEVAVRLGLRHFLTPPSKGAGKEGKGVQRWPLDDLKALMRVLREINKESL